MINTWINPKIIIGNTATGDYYFPRPEIEVAIWDEINKGNHVLIAAPRRVGKSSVMLSMMKTCPNNTQCIFENIQGLQSEEQFYKKFFELIIQCLNRFQKGSSWLQRFLGSIAIEEITLEGVKFKDPKTTNYREEINKILPKLAENDVKVVLFLDELPEILNRLYKKNAIDEAQSLLNNLRVWRQNPVIRSHFHLVLSGSVGIHHIVKLIEGRVSDINDFNAVEFPPLSGDEAKRYITWATQDATVQYDAELTDYLLSRINNFIPYFINLMLDEINKQAFKAANPIISKADIDKAFKAIIKNSDYFKDWKNRLFEYYPTDEANFLHEVLVFISHKNKITKAQLYNLALKHDKKNFYMSLVQDLEKDGYITEYKESFIFISPFLKAFWKYDNPVYDEK